MPNFTLGIEEEFQTIDPHTRELRSHMSKIVEDGKITLLRKPEFREPTTYFPGVAGLNGAIEQRLAASHLLRHGAEWYVGRPVMVTRNDYSTRVFNGDIGVTLPDPARAGALRVYFLEGDAVRSVLATRLRNVETAFAMTVHKSQGSEFRHTVLALPRERNAVLTRELVYTGITRASEVFTLVTPGGDVLQQAIASRTHRTSGLRDLVA